MEVDSPVSKFKSPPTPSSQVASVVSILTPKGNTTATLIAVNNKLAQNSPKNDPKKGKAAPPSNRRSISVPSIARPMPNSPVVLRSPVPVPSVKELLMRGRLPVRPMSSASPLDIASRFILRGKFIPKGFVVAPNHKASYKELAYLRRAAVQS